MGIFESKEAKAYKKKQQVRQTIRKLKKHSDWLDKQKDIYIQRAKEAMLKGLSGSYVFARSGLMATLVQRRRTDEMLLNIELMAQQRDFEALSGSFSKSLEQISKELLKESAKVDIEKLSQLFNKAMGKSGIAADNLDDMLDSNAEAFADLNGNDADFNREIDRLIGVEAADAASQDIQILDDMNAKKKVSTKTDATDALSDDIQRRLEKLNSDIAKPESIVQANSSFNKKQTKSEPFDDKKTSFLDFDAQNDNKKVNDFDSKKDSFGEKKQKPEEKILENPEVDWSYKFNWDKKPYITFNDIAGLDDVKAAVRGRILDRLRNPEKYYGYEIKNTAGLLLIGPPGTGKTMIAAAIANEVDAKFCAVKKGEILNHGVGNSEKALKALFSQARSFKCAVICFDEVDALTSKDTRSSVMLSIRSEFLSEMQGMDEYYKKNGNMLYIIGTTNKPWNIETAFMRTGRFDDRIPVGLPDEAAREYMLRRKINKINEAGVVKYDDNINFAAIVDKTNGFNGSDINNLFDNAQILSANRINERGERIITNSDFEDALKNVKSSVRVEDLEKLRGWMQNGN